jgi:hypothetical protein
MEPRNVGRKNRSPSRLAAELHSLSRIVPEDLFLPSLRGEPPRVQGYAFKFSLTLPLFTADGNRVFLAEHLPQLLSLFDTRFGGCSGTSARSGAPLFGEYLPKGEEPFRDFNTLIFVYANPIDASDRFFHELKPILRKGPLIPQDEILIERSEVYLV